MIDHRPSRVGRLALRSRAKGALVRTTWSLLDRLAARGSAHLSFSQEGEDRILDRLTADAHNRFYIDIGAHHPVRFSNTFSFYLRGWRGINIDPLPEAMMRFTSYRPNDINLPLGVAGARGVIAYYRFNEPAVNTFNHDLAKIRCEQGFTIIGEIPVHVAPLREILAEHVSPSVAAAGPIAFMSIDVEGLDLEVLTSNDWEVTRPEVLCVEDLQGCAMLPGSGSAISTFLSGVGYRAVAKTRTSSLYVDGLSSR